MTPPQPQSLTELGALLKRLRGPMSQKAAGDSLGVSGDAISNWETGRVDIPYSRLVELLDLYGYRLEIEPKSLAEAEALAEEHAQAEVLPGLPPATAEWLQTLERRIAALETVSAGSLEPSSAPGRGSRESTGDEPPAGGLPSRSSK